MPLLGLSCKFCPYVGANRSDLTRHLLLCHKGNKQLKIFCKCGARFSTYRSFKTHCWKNPQRHQRALAVGNPPQQSTSTPIATAPNPNVGEFVFPSLSLGMVEERKAAEAVFLLKLSTEHRMSQFGVKDVIMASRALLRAELADIEREFAQGPIEIDRMRDIFDTRCRRFFESLETEKSRKNFCTEHFNLVMPVQVKLGQRARTTRTRTGYQVININAQYYYVPFLSQLRAMLDMPEIQSTLANKETNFSPIMRDVLDGEYIKSHPGYLAHPDALFFAIYSDDFEVVNPIGSYRRKHKVTAYYWTLLNIPPEHRSKISYIQLLCMAKKVDLDSFSARDKMLSDFVASMVKLQNGIEMDIVGNPKRVFGYLLFAAGDTPAAQLMAGFKEGVGGAEMPCRTCMVSKIAMKNGLDHNNCTLRSQENHRNHLSMLETATDITAYKAISQATGVNEETFLSSVPAFDVTKCVLHDPMHILLEGILKTEIKRLLLYLLNRKYFQLSELNRRIENFTYSAEEKLDKPQIIEKRHLLPQNNFPQTAACMKVLAQTLPFMIGSLIPDSDKNWQNFIVLLQIVYLSLSPIASSETYDELGMLIPEYLSTFMELYPDASFTPKHHYLIHFPKQLEQFGPLRHHWCMRYEAKNGFFKRKRWFNFRNIAKSLSEHHQKWMSLKMTDISGDRSHTYLYHGDKLFGFKKYCTEDVVRDLLSYEPSIGLSSDIMSVKRIVVDGIQYHEGDVLLASLDNYQAPHFVVIQKIIVTEKDKYLQYMELTTGQFVSKLNAFTVQCTYGQRLGIKPFREWQFKWPQIKHMVDSVLLVQLYNIHRSWML